MKLASICRAAVAAVLVLSAAGTPLHAQTNILKGGDFAGDTLSSAWSTFLADWEGVGASFNVSGGVVTIGDIVGTKGVTWHVQLNQLLTPDQIGSLEVGATYRISFDAAGAVDGRPLRMYFGEDGGGFVPLSVQDVSLTTEMTTYTFDVPVTQVFGAMKLGFEAGHTNDAVMIDNVSLTKDDNLLVDGNFGGDALSEAWSTFLADWEGVGASFTVADGMVTIGDIVGTKGVTWHVQLNQLLTPDQIASLEVGATYRISFDAAGAVDGRPLRMYFGEDGGGFVPLSVQDVSLTTEMTTYTFDVPVTQVFGAMKLGFEAGHTNDAVMLANVSLRKLPSNVIVDGDFSGDALSEAWSTFLADWEGVGASFTVADGMVTIGDIVGTKGVTWHVQLNQLLTPDQIGSLQVGATYTISFDAAGAVDGRPLRMYFGEDGGGFVPLSVQDVSLTTEMTTYSFDVVVTQVFGAMKLGFEAGHANDAVMIDNVILYTLEGDGGGNEPEPLPAFGDNRILFVEGPDLTVPRIDGEVVEDVVPPTNLVHKITGGAWYQLGYFWDKGGIGGVDFSQNMADVDTVYFSIRINPADHFSVDTGDRRTGALTLSDVTNGTNTNLQWGISWPFPADAYDNDWHEYAIPLPKPTIAEHDSALKGLDLDGNPLPAEEQYSELQKLWRFDTAWNGSIDVSPNDPDLGGNPEWDKLGRIAISLGNDRSGTFYIDDFYIGSKAAIDLSTALELPDQPAGISAELSGDEMTISWQHDAESNIYAYDLYYSGTTITDVTASGVTKIGTYLANDATSFTHKVASPHPSDVNHEYHYAISPTTSFGIRDASVFSTTVQSGSGEIMPYIFELSPELETAVINVIDSGEIGSFTLDATDYKPFRLIADEDDETWGGEGDASANVWMAFGRLDGLNTFYIYAEVLDDNILAGPTSNPSEMFGTTVYPRADDATTWIPTINDNDTDLEWNYYLKDQLKFNFGTYAVNYVSGTPNSDRSRGERPDYFLSLQPHLDPQDTGAGPLDMLVRFWVTEPNTDNPDVDYNTLYYNSNHLFTYSSVYENIMDGDARVGWRALVAFDVNDLLVATDGGGNPLDSVFEFPAEDEIRYIPMMIELSDKDSGDSGNWWEVPSHVFRYPTAIGGARMEEWTDALTGMGTVAMSGIGVSTDLESGDASLPQRYELLPNYPNPFNPSTTIKFALPKASEVTLNVYNVIGQRVATLATGQRLGAGVHTLRFDASSLSSGIYIYELQAGEFRATRKMMLVK